MTLFECEHSGQLLYFENTRCERCGHTLGYLPDRATLNALVAEGGDRWHTLVSPEVPVRFCANAAYDACNWLILADSPDAFCRACRLNRTLPDLGVPANVLLWRLLEIAKHRLVYGLLRLGLPLVSKVAAAHLCGKQSELQHGAAGPLSLRPGADRHGEAPLRPRSRPSDA